MMISLSLGLKIKNVFKKKNLIISNCNNDDDFNFVFSCNKETDTINKIFGTASIKLTKTAEAQNYFLARIEKNLNLSKYSKFHYNIFTQNSINIATIAVVLFTTELFSYDDCYIYYDSNFSNDWDSRMIEFSNFTKTGSGTLEDIKGVSLVFNISNDNETETLNIDKVEAI